MALKKLSLFLALLITGSLVVACSDTTTVTPAPTVKPSPVPATATQVSLTVTIAPPTSSLTTALPSPTVVLATPPEQPGNGPGGSTYSFGGMVSSEYGEGGDKFHLYEPTKPTPKKAPIILLVHGFTDIEPDKYLGWINHLVRRGNIVVYPVYQDTRGGADGSKFSENAQNAFKNALTELQKPTHVQAELDKFMLVGYSAGGVIAANYAAHAAKNNLPAPKALFTITPGGCSNCGFPSLNNFPIDLEGLNNLPATTKMLVLVGDADIVVGDRTARLIWQSTAQLPDTNRDFITLTSDQHGKPRLIAEHGMTNRTPPDALNFYGIWKFTDALQSCTLENKDCDSAFGDTPTQRFMGKWSDGIAVAEPRITKKPKPL